MGQCVPHPYLLLSSSSNNCCCSVSPKMPWPSLSSQSCKDCMSSEVPSVGGVFGCSSDEQQPLFSSTGSPPPTRWVIFGSGDAEGGVFGGRVAVDVCMSPSSCVSWASCVVEGEGVHEKDGGAREKEPLLFHKPCRLSMFVQFFNHLTQFFVSSDHLCGIFEARVSDHPAKVFRTSFFFLPWPRT